jgi:hypothetical protein
MHSCTRIIALTHPLVLKVIGVVSSDGAELWEADLKHAGEQKREDTSLTV